MNAPVIYLASPFELQDICRRMRDELQQRSIRVSSRWLSEDSAFTETRTDADRQKLAAIDFEDVFQADMLVVLNPKDFTNRGTGGRHSELGMAIALRKRVLLIGVRSQVFHYHRNVQLIPDGPVHMDELARRINIIVTGSERPWHTR